MLGGTFDGHVVQEELDALGNVLDRFRESWPELPAGGVARVFVISPFRTVAEAVRDLLLLRRATAKAKSDMLIDSGTVHTFQGKEADVVILVLGSATGESGAGARAWAAKKPNLLNVAVTRAKSAIYVIGNWRDWSSHRGFSYLARQLPRISGPVSDAKPNVRPLAEMLAGVVGSGDGSRVGGEIADCNVAPGNGGATLRSARGGDDGTA